MFPIFPSPSPYMISVGGTEWERGDGSKPIAWSGSGASPNNPSDALSPFSVRAAARALSRLIESGECLTVWICWIER